MAIRNFIAKISGKGQRAKADDAVDKAMGKPMPAKKTAAKPVAKPAARKPR